MHTNLKGFGGNFLDVVKGELQESVGVQIASGYTSYDILQKFRGGFESVASNGGQARLLLGMAFYEGIASNKLHLLREMSKTLEGNGNGSGVYVAFSRKYHGKIYYFDKGDYASTYVGSSNFSRSGLSENVECTTLVKDDATRTELAEFLEFLFHSDNAVSILEADMATFGSARYKKKLAVSVLSDLGRYDPQTIDKSKLSGFEFPLGRIVGREKSNLNVYFGKGRLNRKTGKISPRPWYEVELIANKDITSSPLYPKGEFLAYTDDGYIIPMMTSGDYSKNIRSQGNLQILGMWIKGKLQKSGSLIPLTPVTSDTLDAYGNDVVRFHKIEDGKYYVEF